jgi:hypothetical protein
MAVTLHDDRVEAEAVIFGAGQTSWNAVRISAGTYSGNVAATGTSDIEISTDHEIRFAENDDQFKDHVRFLLNSPGFLRNLQQTGFHVYKTSDQNFNSTSTEFVFNGVTYDHTYNNGWNGSTRWTAPTTIRNNSLFYVYANISFSNGQNSLQDDSQYLEIRKNGTVFHAAYIDPTTFSSGTGVEYPIHLATLVEMNPSDYLELRLQDCQTPTIAHKDNSFGAIMVA